MKLRTKITATAAAVILIAAALSDGIIWAICRKALYHEAEQTAFRQSVELLSRFEAFCADLHWNADLIELSFFFKQNDDDYVICTQNDAVVYNQTVLTPEELSPLDWSGNAFSNTHYYHYLHKNGRLLLITCAVNPSQCKLYRVNDLSPVTKRLRLLALGMLAVLLVVSVPAVLLMNLLLRRSLRPLSALSAQTKAIAAGAYEERVQITGSDEIGLLASDFNAMANAVQENIRAISDSEQRKTMFMADFSHELKTPLTAISGYAQTLRTVKLSEDDRLEALGYIYSESKRLDRLSKKMMRLMELDKTESLELEKVDCGQLLNAVLATCQPIAEKKQIHLVIENSSGAVQGDFDLLHDALCNLTENAVKASKPAQTVTLSAEQGCITVRDAGCGIPADEIRHLTEPFYMVDKSRSRSEGGAGLGLSIVKQILQLHGAKMTIESTPGAGTAVILQFVYTALNT